MKTNRFLDFSDHINHILNVLSKDFVFFSNLQNQIEVTCSGLQNLCYSACVIFVNRFKGFKDWGFIPFFEQSIAQESFFVITFNFSHCGVIRNSNEITEIEIFSENTFLKN